MHGGVWQIQRDLAAFSAEVRVAQRAKGDAVCVRVRVRIFIINCVKVQRINLGYAWNVSPSSDIHKITKYNACVAF